jgi:type VI secretion system secreted protein VgrG
VEERVSDERTVMAFASAAVPDDTLLVASVDGVEAMSAPFSFELELLSTRDDLDLDALLEADARLGIRRGELHDGEIPSPSWLWRHGVLARIERREAGGPWTAYHATLVPKLWRASLSRRSRLLMDASVIDIARTVLAGCGLAGADLSVRVARDYERREYAVQHDESDLAFVSRLLEHEGVFHRFEHGDERSTLVLGDAPEACAPAVGDPLPYRPVSALAADETGDHWHQPPTAHSWSSSRAAVAATARVQDHDWRAPDRDLRAEAAVADRAAFGDSYEYGDCHRDADAGARYARIRAEELRCRSRLCRARTNHRGLVAGARFALRGHPTTDGEYLAVEVRHRATQQLERGGGAERRTAYANEVLCIPAELPFRPARATPRPRIAGAIHAVVDAAGAGEYAELDEHGRYRVRLPLDLEERAPGAASRPVRMAQPYAGAGMGMHFPLHRGTEVLLVHVNGDPDRPVIAGALANPTTANVVAGPNQTQGILRSASGNELRFDDAKRHEQVLLRAARDCEVEVANDRREQVGRDQVETIARDRGETVRGDAREQVDGRFELRVGKDRALRVDGAADTTIAKDEQRTVGGGLRSRVDGAVSLDVGKDLHERIAGARATTARSVRIEAEEEIVLKAGAASITLRRDGSIVIAGGDVAIRATGTIKGRAAREVVFKGAKLVGN